jgi:regulator of sigma E protease
MLSGILTLVAFGAMIFIHELGHYLAAIRVGVRVEKFYLGFDFWGLKLFKFHHKGTEYGIGVFPLGGYVKLAGQEDFGKADVKSKPDEFTSKSVWQRTQILAAGVIFNFISAFVFSLGAIYLGYRLLSPEVGFVSPGSPAWEAGIRSKDVIVNYSGIPISSFDNLRTEVALGGEGSGHYVIVEREGEQKRLGIQPKLGLLKVPSIGLGPARSLTVSGVQKDSAADIAGIIPGDRLLSIGGHAIDNWEDLSPLVNQEDLISGSKVPLMIDRDGLEMTLEVDLQDETAPLLGFRPSLGRQVFKVLLDSELDNQGVHKGMILKSVNDQPIVDILALNKDQERGTLTLSFESLGKTFDAQLSDANQLMEQLYFGDLDDIKKVTVSHIKKGSPAENMGLMVGDQIQTILLEGEQPVVNPDWNSVRSIVGAAVGKRVKLTVVRDSKTIELSATVSLQSTGRRILGIIPDIKVAETSFVDALMWPFHMLRQTYKGILSLVNGSVPLEHISGPLGILQVTYKVAEVGFAHLLYLMALLSINLAFLNMLPIPVLDGGHLMFCLIEWLKGSPVSEKVMEKFQYVGFVLLMSLFAFATWNDFANRLFS